MGVQIPDLPVSSIGKVTGQAEIAIIPKRAMPPSITGHFVVAVNIFFNPLFQDYPTGSLHIRVDLTDSIKGSVTATLVEQVTYFGKHTPTIFITGRCTFERADGGQPPRGCSFWLMIANNKDAGQANATPDIVSFVVFDNTGARVAYGTGPVIRGDIVVEPLGN